MQCILSKNKQVVAETEKNDESAEKSSAGSRAADIISSVVTVVLSVAILAGAVLFAFNNSPTKSLFGFRYYTVFTPSMSPTYEVGDVVFVKLTSADKINVGDVITFNPSRDSDAYLTHRVFEKIENFEGTGVTCFKTKGDANDSQDSFLIEEERVIGTVRFRIPKAGFVIRFVQLRWYFIVPIVVMLIVLVRLIKMLFDDGEDDTESSAEQEKTASKAE